MNAAETVVYWNIDTKKIDEFSMHGIIKGVIASVHLLAAYQGSINKTTTVAAWNNIWIIPIPITETKIGKLINLPAGCSIVSFLYVPENAIVNEIGNTVTISS